MIEQLAGMLLGAALFAVAVRAIAGRWPWQLRKK
jgi:hypothetical protein